MKTSFRIAVLCSFLFTALTACGSSDSPKLANGDGSDGGPDAEQDANVAPDDAGKTIGADADTDAASSDKDSGSTTPSSGLTGEKDTSFGTAGVITTALGERLILGALPSGKN